MSTYAVFGMTRTRAVEMARKSVPTNKHLGGGEYQNLSLEEWEAAVQVKADSVMASPACVQLSEKYDAPHFAFDYLELARKNGGCRLHVKSWAKSGEKNPKTGKPILEWKLVRREDLRQSRF